LYHSDTEILFPIRVTPYLRDLRGDAWRNLVDQVCRAPDASLDQLAFSLILVRLTGCLTCQTHSYRALRGCTLCATHTIRRFRGEDSELISLFKHAQTEVADSLKDGKTLVGFLSSASVGGKNE
jgi:hypothetical protein